MYLREVRSRETFRGLPEAWHQPAGALSWKKKYVELGLSELRQWLEETTSQSFESRTYNCHHTIDHVSFRLTMRRREFILGTAASTFALQIPRAGAFGSVDDSPICPKCPPPARRLSVFDLRELTSDAADFRLTLACLQGITNRRQPRLYLVQDHYDELWLDWLRERGDIDGTENLDIGEVLARFLPEVGSMYITDPFISASVNVATMLAGLHSALVTTPTIAEQFDLSAGTYPGDDTVGCDLRRMRWKKDVDAYRWFFSRYESQLGRSSVSVLDRIRRTFATISSPSKSRSYGFRLLKTPQSTLRPTTTPKWRLRRSFSCVGRQISPALAGLFRDWASNSRLQGVRRLVSESRTVLILQIGAANLRSVQDMMATRLP